jgi:hypothetical protein
VTLTTQRERSAYLVANTRNLLLFERITVDDIGESSTFHEFHDDPEFGTIDEERIEEIDNVGMLRFFHDQNFVDDELFARLMTEIHLLDGYFRSTCEYLGDEDGTGSALTDFLDL